MTLPRYRGNLYRYSIESKQCIRYDFRTPTVIFINPFDCRQANVITRVLPPTDNRFLHTHTHTYSSSTRSEIMVRCKFGIVECIYARCSLARSLISLRVRGVAFRVTMHRGIRCLGAPLVHALHACTYAQLDCN